MLRFLFVTGGLLLGWACSADESLDLVKESAPNGPPVRGSLMARLIADNDGVIPYPFEDFLSWLGEKTQARMIGTHLPHGRSLFADYADDAEPRTVVTFSHSSLDDGSDPFSLESALFVGYAKRSETIEIISWHPVQGEFEFEYVDRYNGQDQPTLEEPHRSLCTDCHQDGLPIFAIDPWSESSDDNEVKRQIVRARLEGTAEQAQLGKIDLHQRLIEMNNNVFPTYASLGNDPEFELVYLNLLHHTNRLHDPAQIARFEELSNDPTLPQALQVNGIDLFSDEAALFEHAVDRARVLATANALWRDGCAGDDGCRRELLQLVLDGAPNPELDEIGARVLANKPKDAVAWLSVASPFLLDRNPSADDAGDDRYDPAVPRRRLNAIDGPNAIGVRLKHLPLNRVDRAFIDSLPAAVKAEMLTDPAIEKFLRPAGFQGRALTNAMRDLLGQPRLPDLW